MAGNRVHTVGSFADELGLQPSEVLDLCTRAGVIAWSKDAPLDADEVAKVHEFIAAHPLQAPPPPPGTPPPPPPFAAPGAGAAFPPPPPPGQWQPGATWQQPAVYGQQTGPARTDAQATVALVFGIIGFCIPLIGGIVSIVLGAMSRKKIDASAGRLSGRGMAVAGVVLGASQIVVWLAVIGISILGSDSSIHLGRPRLATDAVHVGECFDPLPSANALPKVRDCDKPHAGEMFHQFEMPNPVGAPYPGEQALLQSAFNACQAPFRLFVGSEYGRSKLDIFMLGPNQLSWGKLDDRTVQCAVTRLDGSPLTGTARSSGL